MVQEVRLNNHNLSGVLLAGGPKPAVPEPGKHGYPIPVTEEKAIQDKAKWAGLGCIEIPSVDHHTARQTLRRIGKSDHGS